MEGKYQNENSGKRERAKVLHSCFRQKYSSHDEDCYEPDEDEITVNYEEEFDLQWNPKVRNEVANLTQYEQPRGWINVERKKKRMPVVEDESDLYLKYLLTRD